MGTQSLISPSQYVLLGAVGAGRPASTGAVVLSYSGQYRGCGTGRFPTLVAGFEIWTGWFWGIRLFRSLVLF